MSTAIGRDALYLEQGKPQGRRKIVNQQASAGFESSKNARVGGGRISQVMVDANHVDAFAAYRRKPAVGRRGGDHREVFETRVPRSLLNLSDSLRVDLARIHVSLRTHPLRHPDCHL